MVPYGLSCQAMRKCCSNCFPVREDIHTKIVVKIYLAKKQQYKKQQYKKQEPTVLLKEIDQFHLPLMK